MEENKYYYCHVVGTTDVGCVRKANEDSMGSGETINGLVSVVCDGMGGHVGGATASRLAVDTILDFLNQMYFEDPREAIGKAIDTANMAVLHKVQIQPELRGMGTTCVMILVRDGQVYYGHVGDSRIYLVRKHIIKQLTKDQSYVQMLVDMGQITPEEAEHHERKNEITNAIGVEGMQHATVCDTPINPEAGDCFLLCSDGLSGMVSNHEIEKIVSNQVRMRAQERTDALIEKAKQHGGLDNVTAQIVEFSVTPNLKCKTTNKKKLAMYGGIGLAVIAIAVLLLVLKPWKQTMKAYQAKVDFVADTIFSTIKFEEGKTTVKFGKNDSIVIEEKCDAESFSLKTEGISNSKKDNVIALVFGKDFVDKVEFSLTVKKNLLSKEVHQFSVEVNNKDSNEGAGDEVKNTVMKENTETHKAKVDFKEGGEFATIKFEERETTVKFGKNDPIVIEKCDAESFSLETEGISKDSQEDNVITLKFGEQCVDTVKFSLTVKMNLLSKEIHRFVVAVEKEKVVKGKDKDENKNKTIERHVQDSIEFKPNGIACIIQFVENDGTYKQINFFKEDKSPLDKFPISDEKFKVDGKGKDIEAVDGCKVEYVEDNQGGKYEVRFCEEQPENNIIVFKANDCSGNKYEFSVPVKKKPESGDV